MDNPTAPFPTVDRVEYGRNPLHQVVCQVRFPPLLRLQAQAPFEFQEAVQSHFPIYGEPEGTIELPPQLAEFIPVPPKNKTHRFQSEDGIWTLSVEPSFIALTCSDYRSWEDFSAKLLDAISKLVEIYKPSFFNRIGLRYQNLIRKEWVDDGVGWEELINPNLVGPIADRDLENRLFDASAALRMIIGDHGDAMHFQYGLVEIEGEENRCYLLDFDYFYDQKTETKDAENVISRLYGYSGPAFQWAITPKLHSAMEPKE